MNQTAFSFRLVFLLLFIFKVTGINAQDAPSYRKNAFSFNLTRIATSEVNLSYERYLNSRKSLEFTYGVVYVNDVLAKQAESWQNAIAFTSEHGYSITFHYKVFRRPENNSKWREYISPGLIYRSLYFNDRASVSDVIEERKDTVTIDVNNVAHNHIRYFYYNEYYSEKRERTQIGIEFIWGKVYEASHTFNFEFYYGAQILANSGTIHHNDRFTIYHPSKDDNGNITDDNQWRNSTPDDASDNFFYIRPRILLGIKLRLRI